MVRKLLFTPLIGIILLCFNFNSASAQIENSGDFIRAGIEDANILFKEYLKPFGKGFGPGINSEWIQSAKPHKTLGFDITVRAALAVVPDLDKSFDVTDFNFNQLEYADDPGDSPITPTISGNNEVGPRMLAQAEVQLPDGSTTTATLADFNMPEGTGFDFVPAPVIQAGVGITNDTEIMVRYMPSMTMPFDGSIELFGAGIKHGINQWLPAGNLLPVDLALMGGFTSLDVEANLVVNPEVDNFTRNPFENAPETWDGQNMTMNSEAYTVMALIGKSLPIISVYGGVGYEASTLDLNLNGSYPITAPDNPNDPDFEIGKYKVVQEHQDPVALSYEGANSLKAMAGLRIKLAIISINADYTIGNYPVASAGVGISFR